jgi:ribose 5-phosphate isomerase B
MRIGIATDHGGFGLKEELVAQLRAAGHEVLDFGAHTLSHDDDYPDFVVPLARAVVAGKVDRGLGASVCADKIEGVRACLIHDHFSAKQGVEDDHMNILLHGRTNRGTCGVLGSRPDVLGRRVQSSRAASATPG